MKKLLYVLPYYLETKWDEKIPKPAIILGEEPVNFETFLQVDNGKAINFINDYMIYKKHVLLITLYSKHKDDIQNKTVSISIFITDGVPFWAYGGRKYLLPATAHLDMREVKYTVSTETPRQGYITEPYLKPEAGDFIYANMRMLFVVPNANSRWTMGTASKVRPLTHLAEIDEYMGRTVVVTFDREKLDSQLKVIIRTGSEPDMADFKNPKLFEIVGQKGSTYRVKFKLDDERKNTTNVFISFVPRVSRL